MIEVREYSALTDVVACSGLVWEFWYRVNKLDLDEVVDMQIIDGTSISVPISEAQIYAYLSEGCKIKLAWEDGKAVGLCVAHPIFDNVIAVRALFIDDNYRDKNIGAKLIRSFGDIKKVLFQTRKENPPSELFGKIGKNEFKMISEGDKAVTWEMAWR